MTNPLVLWYTVRIRLRLTDSGGRDFGWLALPPEREHMTEPRGTYKMATKAIHKLGDISRDASDLCIIFQEDAHNYIGNWVTGFGLIGVKFPKETTRNLTDKEIAYWNGRGIVLAGVYVGKLKVD